MLQNNARVASIVAVVGIVLAAWSASGYVAGRLHPRRERRSARHAVARRRN
ncbi:hypothetical protein ACIBL8_25845 [Streptomyces sp. NPDC050523]|uniref:hypothetical protein n=1 Tax=Streptomyces sp. NPDC050523 TaxID=3365622 RepID=UPI0037BBF84A